MSCGRSLELTRFTREGVTLVGASAGTVDFAFTERTGGVSKPPYSSLNLGTHVGDDPAAVQENRHRVLSAMDAAAWESSLLVPNQVHGDRVVVVDAQAVCELDRVREDIAQGADAIVCTAPQVPVMLCFADCVPVVLTCPEGFAVVHSGWRGTYARISAKAAQTLAQAADCDLSDIQAYIGPHILGDEYEVSADLMHTFALQFDSINESETCKLDLACAITQSLEEVGVPLCGIHDTRLSTLSLTKRFYSYRREQGTCGRHAAVAVMR